MSIFLFFILALFLLGIVITLAVGWRRPVLSHHSAAIVVAISLIVWLIAGRRLPLSSGDIVQGPIPFLNRTFFVDEAAWQLCFLLLLLVLAIFLVISSGRFSGNHVSEQIIADRLTTPLTLSLVLAALLFIWTDTIAGLMEVAVFLSLSWLLLFWASDKSSLSNGGAVGRAAILLLPVLFLGLATSQLAGASPLLSAAGSWSLQTRAWVLLAGLVQLGILLLHWWRPFVRSLPPPQAALIHIVPAVAGGSLLIRLANPVELPTGFTLILTLLGLFGMLAAAIIAWMYIEQPVIAAAGLVLFQVSLFLLAVVWTTPDLIVLSLQVLILAAGGLFLVADRGRPNRIWFAAIFMAALAGLPFTAGFINLAGLYNTWISGNRFLLAIVTSLIIVLTLAPVVAPYWREKPRLRQSKPRIEDAYYYAGLLLLAAGLLVFPGRVLVEVQPLSGIAILSAVAGGIMLGRFADQVRLSPDSIRRAFYLDLPGDSIKQVLVKMVQAISTALREAGHILEGEGGLLWLLVLVLILWLARRG